MLLILVTFVSLGPDAALFSSIFSFGLLLSPGDKVSATRVHNTASKHRWAIPSPVLLSVRENPSRSPLTRCPRVPFRP